jgi:hypothetical protein
MNIENIKVAPYEKSIFPGLLFNLSIGYTKFQEAIIRVRGWLETDDGKIIAQVTEDITGSENQGEIAARGTYLDSQFNNQRFEAEIVSLMDPKALSYIDKRRKEDKKGDVNLLLNIKVGCITTNSVVSTIRLVDPSELSLRANKVMTTEGFKEGWKTLVWSYEPQFSTQQTNGYIISGSGSPIFIRTIEQNIKKEIRIPSADWVHDYAPKFGLGEYFIIEIPKGKKTIERAWGYIESAEECRLTWNTKGVFANCREAGSLLDETIKRKFGKESFTYSVKWNRAYDRFNDLSSLDLHLEDIRKSTKYSADDVIINQFDAEYLLIQAKSLIKYVEELIRQ